MPSISKQRRGRRAKVLIKRTCRLGSHSRIKTHHPLYRKLKSNNNSLAKALSDQKQENQILFTQNVELNAQVHALHLACNKRDAVIANVQNKAKEILNMLVTITNYVTNTIIICQEFASVTDTNLRTSVSPLAKRESAKRLSIKSPTRGVVKPMVSGHTITKPTINLSRINVQRFNNMANLSIIEEATTPDINPTVTDTRAVSVAINKKRLSYGNRRGRKLPERIPLTSLTVDDEDEQRMSNRRFSGQRSKRNSVRLSAGDITRYSGNERIGSPRVSLCDVSKLLQKLQTPNVRRLTKDQSDEEINKSHEYETVTCRKATSNIIIPETQASESSVSALETTDEVTSVWNSPTSGETYDRVNYKAKDCENSVPAWEDPMEGPSWLLNDQQEMFSSENDSEVCMKICTKNIQLKETQSSNVPLFSKHAFPFASPVISIQKDILNETMEFTECINKIQTASNCLSVEDQNDRQNVPVDGSDSDNAALTISTSISVEKNTHNTESSTDDVAKSFITQQRGGHPSGDDMEDFTLMYRSRRRAQNTQFNVDDLRIPVLQRPIIQPIDFNISEPEVTTMVHRITQNYPMSTLPNNSTDQFLFDQSAIDLPLIPDLDDQTDTFSPPKKKQLDVQERKGKTTTISSTEPTSEKTVPKKKNTKKKKLMDNKDPSTVKVVLQKLNESYVRKNTPSSKQSHIQESRRSTRGNLSSSRTCNSKDSDETINDSRICSTDGINRSRLQKTSIELRKSRLIIKDINETDSYSSTCSEPVIYRPRRQKAPINLKEPSLNKKLRRNI